jgi:hypothetical protein
MEKNEENEIKLFSPVTDMAMLGRMFGDCVVSCNQGHAGGHSIEGIASSWCPSMMSRHELLILLNFSGLPLLDCVPRSSG